MQVSRTSTSLNNFTEFFKEERDVWVKSIISGQVSIEFVTSPGNTIGITVPYTGDPICLTDRVPFDAIKGSTSLRTLCNPRRVRDGEVKPPALTLLTAEQANAHFEQKAARKGLWVKDETGAIATDEAGKPIPDIQAAAMLVNTTIAPARVVVTPPDASGDMDKPPLIMRLADTINPRVMYLCAQVDAALAPNERWDADHLLIDLEAIEKDLKNDDLQYIATHGFYKTIKAWAEDRLNAKGGAE